MESELLGTAGEVFGRREEVTKQRGKDNAEAQRTLRSAEEEKSGEENPKRGTIYRAPTCFGTKIGSWLRT